MKLYHGSPRNLKILKPQLAKGDDEFENQRAIYLTKSKIQAALYALGKTLKNKTCFALPPNQLVIVGKSIPSKGYVYEVDVDANKGIWDQYSYPKEISNFKKIKVSPKDYERYIWHVKTKEEMVKICNAEKKIWLNKNGYCIPELIFKPVLPKHYLEFIMRFLNPKKDDWNWKDKILKKHPKLRKRLNQVFDINKRREIIENYFFEEHKKKIKIMKEKSQILNKSWSQLSEEFFISLSNMLGIYFPKKMSRIVANITLNPICPRDTFKYNFDIYYDYKISQSMAIIMHEIFHFLYFEKCKKVFGKKRKIKSDKNLFLHLSEIVPRVILNTSKFQKIMRYDHKTYPEYLKIKINNTRIDSCIEYILKKSNNFEEFLINADKFMFRNRKTIKKALKD